MASAFWTRWVDFINSVYFTPLVPLENSCLRDGLAMCSRFFFGSLTWYYVYVQGKDIDEP